MRHLSNLSANQITVAKKQVNSSYSMNIFIINLDYYKECQAC